MSGSSGKRKSAATQKPPQEKKDPYFSRANKEERYGRFALRKMATHKVLELDWFMERAFTFPRLIVAQHLDRFCTLNGNVYPKLIYEFYANLIKRNNVWVTDVSGQVITLSHSTLEAVGGLRNSGLTYETILDPEWSVFRALETYENCLREGKIYDGRTMKTGLITVNDRMLHYVLVYLIAPRLSNRAQMSDEDLRYIFAIKNELEVNWADIILNIMLRRFRDPTGVLPYPALVSKMIELAGVDTTNEAKLSVRDGVDKIGQAVLNKMKISRRGVEWTWNEDENDAVMAENEVGQNFSMEELLSRMQGMLDTSTGLIREDIRALNERVDRGFAHGCRDPPKS